MTELELYKFVKDNDLEYHWNGNNVFLFVNHWNLDEFIKLLANGSSILDEEGIECTLKDGYLAVEMDSVCGYFGIELKNVFVNNN